MGSPGAGKTALLADWLAARPQRPAAWLGCDPADADPVRFVAAIIEALRRTSSSSLIGEDALQLLSLDGQVSADVIAALADDLERLDTATVLVVDDFHLTGEAGAAAAALLLEYRPASLQVVLASRADPPLRLQRMRANQELVELRDRDLSFSPEETSRFLSGFGLHLREEELAVVYQRSEGWAAGLQMAAISIQQSPDPDRAAGRLGLHRHTVAGYFLDEVLYRQPPPVVQFMLATSVLDELSAAASTALCGPGSAALLEGVYRAHLFVTMVDAEAGTYRYHQLIKEVLRAELHARDPDRERQLEAAAADYLAEAGQVGPAARHLLAAGQPAAAFNLLSQRVVRDFSVNPTLGSALDLDDIQPDVFADAPEILVPLAAELLMRGAFERGARTFALAQQAGVDPDRQPDLAVKLAFLEAQYCGLVGQLDESLAHRHRAYRLATDTTGLGDWIVAVDVVAMYCHALLDQFSQARQLAGTVAAAQLSPAVTEVLCPGVISQAAMAEGALAEAQALTDQALAAAGRLGFERHYFAFSALRSAALMALERHDLATAADLTEHILGMLGGGRPVFDYLAQLDRARIWAAGGNLDEALTSLPAARLTLRSDHSVLLAHADELEARLHLALGDQKGAERVAERLPDNRRMIISAVIALAVGNPQKAAAALGDAPAPPTTIRDRSRGATAAGQHRHRPNLAPGPATDTGRPRHRRTPRLPPNRVRHRPVARRPPDHRLDPLPSHRQSGRPDRRPPRNPPARQATGFQQRQTARPPHRRRNTRPAVPTPATDLRRHGNRTAPLPQHRKNPSAPRLHETRGELPHRRGQTVRHPGSPLT